MLYSHLELEFIIRRLVKKADINLHIALDDFSKLDVNSDDVKDSLENCVNSLCRACNLFMLLNITDLRIPNYLQLLNLRNSIEHLEDRFINKEIGPNEISFSPNTEYVQIKTYKMRVIDIFLMLHYFDNLLGIGK